MAPIQGVSQLAVGSKTGGPVGSGDTSFPAAWPPQCSRVLIHGLARQTRTHTRTHTHTHTHIHAHTHTHTHTHTVVPMSVPHPYNPSSVDSSEQLPDRGAMNYVQRMPVGVAGLISPWNLPLYLLTFKIAPCIAYGNTCVCKPSELTSLTAYMMCEVLSQAGG